MKTMKKLIAGALAVSLLFVQSNTTALAANTPTATKSQTLAKGQKATIKVTGKFIKSKSFKSTNTKVVTVNKKGVVTAVNPGKCNIKITVTYRKTKTAKKLTKKVLTTKVTVTKKDQATSNPSAKPTKAPDEDSEVIDTSNVTFESYMDEGDVKALSKIIREQDALGVELPTKLDKNCYEWNQETGRLTAISWYRCELQGEISFSKFTALIHLDCEKNQLTGLDISKNTALIELDCSENQLTGLDMSKNTALTYLDCAENQLTGLDISKNTALEDLYCDYNDLTSLDVSGCTALTELDCSENQLTSLDVSKNTALKRLGCTNNQLTSLDISKNTALTYLSCYENQLTSLDISRNTALEELWCNGNQLTSLDISKNPVLFYIDIDDEDIENDVNLIR